MKKFLAVIAIIAAITTLNGCTKDQSPNVENSAENLAQTEAQQSVDIPEDSSNEYDLNLENAILELDLVE